MWDIHVNDGPALSPCRLPERVTMPGVVSSKLISRSSWICACAPARGATIADTLALLEKWTSRCVGVDVELTSICAVPVAVAPPLAADDDGLPVQDVEHGRGMKSS